MAFNNRKSIQPAGLILANFRLKQRSLPEYPPCPLNLFEPPHPKQPLRVPRGRRRATHFPSFMAIMPPCGREPSGPSHPDVVVLMLAGMGMASSNVWVVCATNDRAFLLMGDISNNNRRLTRTVFCNAASSTKPVSYASATKSLGYLYRSVLGP